MAKTMSVHEARELKEELVAMLPQIRGFSLETEKKSDHLARVDKLRRLHCTLGKMHLMYFPDNRHYFCCYKDAVVMQEKKTALDSKLRYSVLSLHRDVAEHIRVLEQIINHEIE